MKMIIAWVLAKCEEDGHSAHIDWKKLVEGSMFELLHRIVLTDIEINGQPILSAVKEGQDD